MSTHRFVIETAFEAPPMRVRAFLTPFDMPEGDSSPSILGSRESDGTRGRGTSQEGGMWEEHEFELEAPLRWRRETLMKDPAGVVVARARSVEEIVPTPKGCVHRLEKTIIPLTRQVDRALWAYKSEARRFEANHWKMHAKHLERQLRERAAGGSAP